MDIIVWQKFKNTEKKKPSPLLSVLIFNSVVLKFLMVIFFFVVTTLIKGEGGTFQVYLKFLPHIMSMIVVVVVVVVTDIYCGQPTNLGLLGSLSVVSRGSTVKNPVITKSCPMSEFGRVTVTTKLGQLSQIMTDFQLEQLDYDRSGDQSHNIKHRNTLTIPNLFQELSYPGKFYSF